MTTDATIYLIAAAAIIGTVVSTATIPQRKKRRARQLKADMARHPSNQPAYLGQEDYSDTPIYRQQMEANGYRYNAHLEKHWPYCPDDCPWRTSATTEPDFAVNGGFCSDCPDHEACSTGYDCRTVKTMAERQIRNG